jgi:hypothetical protein
MVPPHFESPRPPKLGQVVTPQVEEDRKKGNGKSFLSRMFGEKRSEPIERVEEKTEPKAEEAQETVLRIAACGQPRIVDSGSVEIPLTVEMSNGQGKNLSVSLKVAVHLDSRGVQGS